MPEYAFGCAIADPNAQTGTLDERSGRLGLFQLGQALGDRGLAVRGLVLVDDALADRLVELTGGRPQRGGRLLDAARVRGLAELADVRLQGRLNGLVALVRLLVLTDALD